MNIRFITSVISSVLTISLISGCAGGPQEQGGGIVGGVVGAAVGSTIGKGDGRTAAIILGTLAGSMIGANVGRYMDEQDRVRTAEVLEFNRTGQTDRWTNPDSGYDYAVTPTRTYESTEGPCREFTMDAMVGGRLQQVYGTACRQADGSWKMVK